MKKLQNRVSKVLNKVLLASWILTKLINAYKSLYLHRSRPSTKVILYFQN